MYVSIIALGFVREVCSYTFLRVMCITYDMCVCGMCIHVCLYYNLGLVHVTRTIHTYVDTYMQMTFWPEHMYVCMCVYMHVRRRTAAHAHVHVTHTIHTYVDTYILARNVCTYVCMCVYICMDVRIQIL